MSNEHQTILEIVLEFKHEDIYSKSKVRRLESILHPLMMINSKDLSSSDRATVALGLHKLEKYGVSDICN